MYIEYFYWHYVLVPRWLATFSRTLHRALLQFFSVRLMLRTLFAHWHRDAVPYRPGGLSQIFITFAWNQISRGIGFLIRLSVLIVWTICEKVLLFFLAMFWLLVLVGPLAIIFSLAAGLAILIFG